MPSMLHEGIVRLFRERPELAPTLVRDALGVALPPHGEVALESVDLTHLRPAARYADVVVVLRDGAAPVHALIVEVQLRRDDEKLRSWPAYAANLRSRLGCPVDVVVFTTKRSVARWAARPIVLGTRSVFGALVLGPEQIPRITDPEQAKAACELAVLGALAHARGEVEEAIETATAALDAVRGLEDERALFYADLVWAALSAAARGALQALMRSGKYEYQSEFARKYFGAGKAEGRAEGMAEGEAKGRAEGKAEGKAELLAKLMRLKFGPLPARVRERLRRASPEELDRWAERILTAASIDDVLR